MKIGVLTQPLYNNYGGILQAYALIRKLEELGHEAWLIQRDSPKVYDYGLLWRMQYRSKAFIKRLLRIPAQYKSTLVEERTLCRETYKFVNQHIVNKSSRLLTGDALKSFVRDNGFEAIVVGSDQVWRPSYSPDIKNFYLDFCEDNAEIKRIAYAASFGVDQWEYTPEETAECRRLAGLFDAVSVRESSGIQLCRDYLGIKASLVLDPTFFYSRKDYEALSVSMAEPPSPGDFFCYVLDMDYNKNTIIGRIEETCGLTRFSVKPEIPLTRKNIKSSLELCVSPRVTEWLRAFQDARMVFTDSFHGCVFSIIYHIPFWTVMNPERGNARIQSLLALFGLQDRLILPDMKMHDYNAPIDWTSVDSVRKELVEKSDLFLSKLN